jgi:hypothetical protein
MFCTRLGCTRLRLQSDVLLDFILSAYVPSSPRFFGISVFWPTAAHCGRAHQRPAPTPSFSEDASTCSVGWCTGSLVNGSTILIYHSIGRRLITIYGTCTPAPPKTYPRVCLRWDGVVLIKCPSALITCPSALITCPSAPASVTPHVSNHIVPCAGGASPRTSLHQPQSGRRFFG